MISFKFYVKMHLFNIKSSFMQGSYSGRQQTFWPWLRLLRIVYLVQWILNRLFLAAYYHQDDIYGYKFKQNVSRCARGASMVQQVAIGVRQAPATTQ